MEGKQWAVPRFSDLFKAAALPFVVLLLLLQPLVSAAKLWGKPSSDDGAALLRLRAGFANSSSPLSSWTRSTKPCNAKSSWAGVFCFENRVAALRLNGMRLSGTVDVDALKLLSGLRALSLANNSFSGAIPDGLHDLQGLEALYLSHNGFSGDIPAELFEDMSNLSKLWLASNKFTGPIPLSIARAKNLVELRLENNKFSGPLPELDSVDQLESFSVANNELVGPIPEVLAWLPLASFKGNPKMCGTPLGGVCESPAESQPPAQPMPSYRVAFKSLMAIISVSVLMIAAAMYLKYRRELGFRLISSYNKGDFEESGVGSSRNQSIGVGESNSQKNRQQQQYKQGSGEVGRGTSGGGGGTGELVMLSEGNRVLGMGELMKASAAVLGSGGLGSAYKAVMEDGEAVVVKRMRDMNRVEREEFDAEMRRLGRVKHTNVLPPLAFHYRKEEKLLVYQFVPKGSLLYVLHGNQGADRAALNWLTRLKILRGIARGMSHLHAELVSHVVPHGNLKSGNVLLSPDFEPLLVDFGFVRLVNPAHVTGYLFAFRSPEAVDHHHVSPKSDVYCFGIIILEVLTGKFPTQYLINTKGGTDVVRWATAAVAEGRNLADLLDPTISAAKSAVPAMERLLRIGAACADADPEQRPTMSEAAAQVEDIAAQPERVNAVASAPSLKNRYAELGGSGKHTTYVRDGVGEVSARRSSDAIAFAIS